MHGRPWAQQQRPQRQVLAFFCAKWVIYDRYGQFKFGTSQASRTSLEPSAAASLQGGVEGPVPNTVYKDDKRVLDGVDDLVLTPDALRYYEALHERREGLAEEARADAGESAFFLIGGFFLRHGSRSRGRILLCHLCLKLTPL